MKYNFETFQDRTNLGSRKYQLMHELKKDVSKRVIPLSVADMEINVAPEITDGLKEALNDCILGYPGDYEDYRKTVVSWIKRRYKYDIQTSWIVETPGVVPALYAAVEALTQKKDGVIVFSPVYGPFFTSILDQDREVVKVDLKVEANSYSIDFEEFERQASLEKNKMLIFCNPHNPVGRVWTKEELERVSEIAEKNNLYIVSDEIHADIIMPGHQFTSMGRVGSDRQREKTIISTAASKTFNIAGLKTSNIIIRNEEIREKFKEVMNKAHILGANLLGMLATKIAYEKGEAWLDEMLKVIDGNVKYISTYIDENLAKIKHSNVEGTYLMYLDFRGLDLSQEDLDNLLINKAELFMNDGSFFGDERKCFKRINLGCPKYVLEEAMARLKKAIEEI